MRPAEPDARTHAPQCFLSLTHTHRFVFSRLVACSNTGVSVEQWKQQLEKWSNLPPKYIACFTASQKDRVQTDALVLITTYNMVGHTCKQQRSALHRDQLNGARALL